MTDLQFKIKTILEGNGIVVAESDLAKLAQTAERVQRPVEGAATAWEKLTDEQKQSQREAAQAALKQIEAAEAAKKNGQEAAKLSQQIGKTKEAFSGFSQLIGGLLTGNLATATQGFLSLTKIMAGLSGPIGLVITALGVLGGVFLAIRNRMTEVGDSTKKLSADFNSAAKEGQLLEKIKFDNLAKELDRALGKSKQLLETFKQVKEVEDKKDTAKTDAEIAKVQADPKLTDAQKEIRITRIRAGLVGRQRGREDSVRDAGVRAAEDEFFTRQSAAKEVEGMRDEVLKRVRAAEEQAKVRQDRIDELNRLNDEQQKFDENGQVSDAYVKRTEEIKRLQQQNDYAKESYTRDQGKLDTLTQLADQRRAEADKAGDAYTNIRQSSRIDESALKTVRSLEDSTLLRGLQQQRTKVQNDIRTAAADKGSANVPSDLVKTLRELDATIKQLQGALAASKGGAPISAGSAPSSSVSPVKIETEESKTPSTTGITTKDGKTIPISRESTARGGTIEKGGKTYQVSDEASVMRQIGSAATQLSSAVKESAATTAGELKRAANELKKQDRQMKNSRVGGGS